MSETRLNKAISETGFCSRREADKLIESGKVRINGETAGLGVKVQPGDSIEVDGQVINRKTSFVYLAFHKPVGIICTTDTSIKGNIIDYIRYPERIFPVGRLDKPSEGLIFMTSDGDIVNKILRSGNNHEKEYIVKVDKEITGDFIRKMGNGVPVLDTVTKKCKVEKIDPFTFRIILTQGLNRQIRRMCQYLGYEVRRLQRIRIMNVSLEGIPKGKYRELTGKEMNELMELVKDSDKTMNASL